MKNIIIVIISIGLLYLLSTSCEDMFGDYLDKPPGIDVTEDTIFSTQRQAETFLNGIYRYGIETNLPMWDRIDAKKDIIFSNISDESQQIASWFAHKWWNYARMHPGRNGDNRWYVRWTGLRSVNLFLERVDDVPASQTWIDQAKGQARFIRCAMYQEMLWRYGGLPIVDKRFDAGDDMKVPRSTLSETIEFMVADCEYAASVLPDRWPSADRGRVNKGAALAQKALILLHAASPRFNTGTPPIDLPGHNDLICYGNYDASRWQRAADAAQAVIDWAPTAGIELVTDQGIYENYFYTWEEHHNSEIIMGNYMWWHTVGPWSYPFSPINNFYAKGFGSTVTLNFVSKYEKLDGTPQAWKDAEGNYISGNNLSQMYAELDPRFSQSITYNGSYWNDDFPIVWLYEGAGPAGDPPLKNCWGGHWLHKWVPRNATRNNRVKPWSSVYRLAEFYLIKAEALNEAQGPVAEAYNAVNVIRARSGMPDFPPGLTQDEFRQKIRNERAVEMFAENRRPWDLMRWRIAHKEGYMNGSMWGIKITKNDPPSTEYSWEPYVFNTHTFNLNMYFVPFYDDEVNKGYIIQNPGW